MSHQGAEAWRSGEPSLGMTGPMEAKGPGPFLEAGATRRSKPQRVSAVRGHHISLQELPTCIPPLSLKCVGRTLWRSPDATHWGTWSGGFQEEAGQNWGRDELGERK